MVVAHNNVQLQMTADIRNYMLGHLGGAVG